MQEIQETQVWLLCWNNPLEKETALHSSIFAWEIPWTEEVWQATVHGVAKESDITEDTHLEHIRRKVQDQT